MLTQLGEAGVPHVVCLLGSGSVRFANALWSGIAVGPYVDPVTHISPLKLITQVRLLRKG